MKAMADRLEEHTRLRPCHEGTKHGLLSQTAMHCKRNKAGVTWTMLRAGDPGISVRDLH